MGHLIRPLPVIVIALAALAPGCTSGSRGRFTAEQMQTRLLNEQVQAQQLEIENLKNQNRTVQNQLIQAEEELAEMDQRQGVDRRQIANSQRDRRSKGGGEAPPDDRLERLSKRYDWLQYDPATGVSRFDTELLFGSGEAELRPDARETLDDLARFLKSPEAAELRVMIVGHTDSRQIKRPTRDKFPDNWHLSAARALAVADYLRDHGVREDQLGVAGYGHHQPISDNKDAEDRQFNRRVEVFVMGPETPVVGWTEANTTVY